MRALKMHGGVAKADLAREDVNAVARGVVNLARHVENLRKFGVPVVVALNNFVTDTAAEFDAVRDRMGVGGVDTVLCTHWADGAAGAETLAQAVMSFVESRAAGYTPLYPPTMGLVEKIRTVAQQIYRARDVSIPPAIMKRLNGFETAGFGHMPVCIAKTQYSFSTDPTLMGAPDDHVLHVREVRLSAGAGFVVAVCGEIMTMPGLPRTPAANSIRLDAHGLITGLF